MTQKASEISGCHPDELVTSKAPSQDVLNWMDIAERYAAHVAEQACIKQRELCAAAGMKAYKHEMVFEEKFRSPSVLFDKILNTSLVTDKP